MDTASKNSVRDNFVNSIEMILDYLRTHPIEADDETAVWKKLGEVLQHLNISPAERAQIVELLKARFVRMTSSVEYFFDSKSTRNHVMLTVRNHDRQKERSSKETLHRQRESASKEILHRVVLIDGTVWPDEVKLPARGRHSGGGGRRPHAISYGVLSPLHSSSYLSPGGRGVKGSKKNKKRHKKKTRKRKK